KNGGKAEPTGSRRYGRRPRSPRLSPDTYVPSGTRRPAPSRAWAGFSGRGGPPQRRAPRPPVGRAERRDRTLEALGPGPGHPQPRPHPVGRVLGGVLGRLVTAAPALPYPYDKAFILKPGQNRVNGVVGQPGTESVL